MSFIYSGSGSGNASTNGLVPVGGSVPIFSNITGAYSPPSSGTVDASGWMRADGAAIPAGQTMSGNTPDATGGRFIYGTDGSGSGTNVAAGSTGGSNSTTLVAGQIPQMTTDSFTPAGTLTITGTNNPSSVTGSGSTSTSSTLNESNQHTHGTGVTTGVGGGSATFVVAASGSGNTTSAENTSHTHAIPSLTVNWSGTAAAQIWAVGTKTFTGTPMTTTVGNSSPSAVSTLPSYVAAVYVIRVS